MSRPRRRAVLLLALALGAAVFVTAVAGAGPRDRTLTNVRYALRIEAPPGWTLSSHTGYPSIITLLLHAEDGARISVSAADTTAPDARAFADENRRGLEAQGMKVTAAGDGPRGGAVLRAIPPRGDAVVEQVYLVRPLDRARQGIVVTLTCRPADLAVHRPALEATVKRLGFLEPAESRADADAGAG